MRSLTILLPYKEYKVGGRAVVLVARKNCSAERIDNALELAIGAFVYHHFNGFKFKV